MKQRPLKMKILSLLLLFAVLLSSGAYAAEPELLFHEGFEHWQVTTVQDGDVMKYEIICPEANLTMDKLQSYTLYIMSYCKAKNPMPSSVTIHFPYEGASFQRMSIEVMGAISMDGGIRAVSSSFLNLSSCRMRQKDGTVSEVLITLDVNNPSSGSFYARDIPLGASLDAMRKLAADIQAKTSDPREQLRLLNNYLIKHVKYGESNGINRACSPVGTMLDGEAVCSGYSSTISDVCHLLGIPNYQLYDRPNSHIWNVVLINGQWLMLDTTANDTGNKAERFFLQPDFHDEYHSYTEEMKIQLAAHAMKLNEAEMAAQQLRDSGILQGNGTGSFALADALTYEALAVILTRLDGAEVAVQANGAAYSALAKSSGAQAWATAYIGYCIERGYFNTGLFVGADNRVTINAAKQIMSRQTGAYDLQKISPIMGEYLLRGSFFCLILQEHSG